MNEKCLLAIIFQILLVEAIHEICGKFKLNCIENCFIKNNKCFTNICQPNTKFKRIIYNPPKLWLEVYLCV